MTTYGPRCNVHPDRFGATRTGRLRLLVVHTSEGGEDPIAAEGLCSFMQSPGDRVQPDGSRFGASYHYVTDTDRVLPAVPDNVVAYAAAGANNDGIHVCMPGKAAQTRDQWLDTVSRAYIRQMADVMVDKGREYAIPLRRLTVAQIVAGESGYCGHVDISNAYHRSDHTDPGSSFPWDVLAVLVNPEVPTVQFFNVKNEKPSTLWGTEGGLIAVRISPETAAARTDIPAVIPVLTKEQAARFEFVSGLPSISVQ